MTITHASNALGVIVPVQEAARICRETGALAPDGHVIDDVWIYRLDRERYWMVVNAANNDKDWAWMNAVNEGKVAIDSTRPWARNTAPCVLRDLRDLKWGDECRVDIALQGPKSKEILVSICDDKAEAAKLNKLPRTDMMRTTLRGFDVIISRTGYTGESVAYELFVHPDKAPAFWDMLMEVGTPLGMKPIGLGARDSLRTERAFRLATCHLLLFSMLRSSSIQNALFQ